MGRHPKTGKKKGGIKVHSVIHANDSGHLPPPLADRVTFQADQAEFSPLLLLWRKRQRYQDPDMGHSHRQSPAFGAAKPSAKAMELLRIGDNRAYPAHVLHQSREFLESTGGQHAENAQGNG